MEGKHDSSVIPKFTNSKDQLMWFFKDFMKFCGTVCEATEDTMLKWHSQLNLLPEPILIASILGWLSGITEDDLAAQNPDLILSTAKLARSARCQMMGQPVPETVDPDMEQFVQKLKDNPKLNKKFFSYLKIMIKVIDGGKRV